ncbi:SNF1-related protein kinase catalytic subunit alpha KIN10 [Forsythia ovata]|uniref:non-specific serine/threonine protein kinase n=1 Tax=Forsythia ovata TaxID=205694 RepID=A0ABD1WRD7_9LAMI
MGDFFPSGHRVLQRPRNFYSPNFGIFIDSFLLNMDGSRQDGSVDSFLRNYKLGKTLGIGSFGKVKIAEHTLTGHKVAVKILNRKKIKNMDMEEKVRREIKILRLFMHPHIIRLYEVVETHSDIYVVMEYVKSGELFDYIVEKGRLQEDEARIFFQQIISGVEYCHRNMVVHRDLKPENLLLDSKCNVKIADFGLSNIMRDGHFLKTSCGSPNYAAPEVISGKLYAGPEVDVWSCGVILYALLCGTLPFDDENIPNLFKKIKGGIYTLPSHLSPGARDLIPRMLIVDPMKRMTIPEIRAHPWFQAHLPRYLAVPPPDTMQQAKKIDEEILQEVVKMGFDRNVLVESLSNRVQNEGTVSYYLLLDNRFRVSSGYLGAEFQETMEFGYNHTNLSETVTLPVGQRLPVAVDYQQFGGRPQIPVDRKWALGLQSRAHPREIMTEVLKALQELNVCWKKIGQYNMKCRWISGIPGHHEGVVNNSMHDNGYFSDESAIIENDGVIRQQNVVKFEVQLYKTREDKYLLDLQRVQGPQFLFLDLCAAFLAQLRVL